MPKSKQLKEKVVTDLSNKIKGAKGVVIATHEGLTVVDSQTLRENCKAENVEFVAIKKTLLRRALQEAGIGEVDTKAMEGSLAVAISRDDEVAPARILKTFGKKHEQVAFCGGVLDGAVVTMEQVKFLADLPSKEELLAKVVGSMKAPISGFVNVLSGNLRGLVRVLTAIKDNK